MRDGSQHAEMHNTPVIYRLQQRDTNVVVVTAASVGEASLQRLLGTISAVRAADGDSWWRGFWPGGDCSQRDEWTLRGGEETGELRRPRRPEPLRTEACTRPASSSNQVLRCAFLTLRCAFVTLRCAVLTLWRAVLTLLNNGVGHRAQLMLRPRRGDMREQPPCPVIAYTNTTKALSLPVLTQRGVTTTESRD